jgi:hypothetical protein
VKFYLPHLGKNIDGEGWGEEDWNKLHGEELFDIISHQVVLE